MTLLSICIVNWNTRDYLRETLASLEAFPVSIAQEVIVVDNASADGSAEMVLAEFPNVHLIANKQNAGYAEGNNQALAQAAGDWLLLLNPDVRVDEFTLSSALAAAQELPEFGALGIKQIGSDGNYQASLRSFPDPLGVFFEVTGISKIFPKSRFLASYRMTWFDYNTTIEVDQPMATFLLTTRKVYELVGGMDTDFPIFFNDVDWCFRVKQCEKKIYYSPQPEIAHYGGAATSKANRAAMAVESKTSLLKFYKKHYYGKVNPAIYNIVQLAVRISLFVKKAQTLVRKSMGK